MTLREVLERLNGVPVDAELYVAVPSLDEHGKIVDVRYYEPYFECWNEKDQFSHWIVGPKLSKLISG